MFVELLAPAGSPEALDAAIGEGADAVYLGLKNFNARMRSVNFTYAQFEGALRTARRMGRKIYVTVNTVFEQREADRVYQLLKYLAGLGPDGLIVQDFGAAAMARAHFPALKLHASTQMNIASSRGANALSKYGISRVVLARELSLSEIQELRFHTNMELEVFVHGALCVSASGLCLFSSYLGGKSANRGMCTQACRRLYRRSGPDVSMGGGVPEEGYFFSPADLQLLEWIPRLVSAGVNSFKIEGRMKSAEYVGTVVAAHRKVIDAILEEAGEEKLTRSIQEGLAILRNDFARNKTVFYMDGGRAGTAAWLNPSQAGGTGISLGPIIKVRGQGENRQALIAGIPARTSGLELSGESAVVPAAGDSIRLHRRDDSARLSHKLTFAALEAGNIWLSVPEGFDAGDMVYLIQTRAMGRRYAPVIPKDLSRFKRMPGHDKAPEVEIILPVQDRRKRGGSSREDFPNGCYAMVSRIEDLYILQSVRPVRVMLMYNRKIASCLLGEKKQPLPFGPHETIIFLDPYLPQNAESILADEIPRLVSLGYHSFVLNNPGHFSMFREAGQALLIAGPWLYMFNRWSASFAASLGASYFIPPQENNRQNLEKTFIRQVSGLRFRVFITVFCYPPLFRIRAGAEQMYGFTDFTGSRGEHFKLIADNDGSAVFPGKPFSIVDKIPFLEEAGFHKFILDFSGPPLKKKDYKDIMNAVKNTIPLANTVRFNWKDGFFSTPAPGPEFKNGGNAADGAALPGRECAAPPAAKSKIPLKGRIKS